jgi:DNA-binding SARP family transcriptional activator
MRAVRHGTSGSGEDRGTLKMTSTHDCTALDKPAPVACLPSVRPGARLTLLGGFGLQVGGTVVPLAAGPQRLVALLALHERALSRAYVAGILWADSTESRAHGSLRSTLWKLRVAGLNIVEINGDSLELSPDIEVDVRYVMGLARDLVAGHFGQETFALAESRCSGELLPGWYEDWVELERERHRQLTLHALESLCEHFTATRRYGPAVLAGLAAVGREPLRESAHRALIQAHLAEGNAGEAVRRYRRYAEIADRELGVEPSPMMRALLNGIAATAVTR